MKLKAVLYKDAYQECWLMPGSEAHRLHAEGKLAELKIHMSVLDAKFRATHGLNRAPNKEKTVESHQ